MSTWNQITIENPGSLTLDTLPDALRDHGEMWDGYSADDKRVTIPAAFIHGYERQERPGVPDGSITIHGGGKYRADEAIAALVELSKSTGRITHYQEWDDDEGGRESTVYEGGEYVPAASQTAVMMPDNLHELVTAVRAARQTWQDSMDPNGYDPTPSDTEAALDAAVVALLDAIAQGGEAQR